MKKLVLVLVSILSVLSISAVGATSEAQATIINITIYAGEISTSQYRFGNSSTAITSPETQPNLPQRQHSKSNIAKRRLNAT
jgi:hypothetical protein